MTVSCEPLISELAHRYQEKELKVIRQAFDVAARWHEGQRRKSGEAYVAHPLAVAMIAAEAGATREAVCAALLHDLVEDTPYTFAQMRAEFGEEVTALVEGMYEQPFPQEADPAIAMSVLVKLADRLHNMRTLRFLEPAKQIRKSRETLELAAPTAHRFGLEAIKFELEELALAVLRPAPATDRPTRTSWWLLRHSTFLLPKPVRARWAEEWAGEMFALRTRAQRLRYAWQTIRGVPRLAVTVAPYWVTVFSRVAQTLGLASALVAVTIPMPVLAWLLGGLALAFLSLAAAVLFGRSEAPARRLAELIRAWRR